MANIVLEFGVERVAGTSHRRDKICRFTISNYPDEYIVGLSAGDEIGFDLVESKEFFYVSVSRKVYLSGRAQPIYVICVPHNFSSPEYATEILDKFKLQFKDDLVVDT